MKDNKDNTKNMVNRILEGEKIEEVFQELIINESHIFSSDQVYYILDNSNNNSIVLNDSRFPSRWSEIVSNIYFEENLNFSELIDNFILRANFSGNTEFKNWDTEYRREINNNKKVSEDFNLAIFDEVKLKPPLEYPQNLSLKIELIIKIGVFGVGYEGKKLYLIGFKSKATALAAFKAFRDFLGNNEDIEDSEKRTLCSNFCKNNNLTFLSKTKKFFDLFDFDTLGKLVTHFNCYVSEAGKFIDTTSDQVVIKTSRREFANLDITQWKELAKFETKRAGTDKDLKYFSL